MKCVKCGVDLREKPLYRTTPKGQPGQFTCKDCLKGNVPQDVKKIVTCISDSVDTNKIRYNK